MTNAKRILIADDDKDLAEALAHRCRKAGLIVETAHDGMTALQKINSFGPDLLVLDVNMPHRTGLAVCEMISRDSVLGAIPVIVLTGRNDMETRERCQTLRAQYVAKSPNVWLRLESLINDRLGLPAGRNPAVQEANDRTNLVCRKEQQHLGPPRVHSRLHSESGQAGLLDGLPAPDEPLTEEDRILDAYIDTIFSALGELEAGSNVGSALARAVHAVARPRVLCIDDDSDMLNSLRLRLERHGIEINQATEGIDGYLQAFHSEMQAIILDYEMPNVSGDYVLRRLKENPVTSNVPVIVLSGRKDRALERILCNLGAVKYLTKPVEWDKLTDELRRHIQMAPNSLLL
jgi:DNA-binding response OmpR family regulator